MADVYITKCDSYDEETVKVAMEELLDSSGLLSFIKPQSTQIGKVYWRSFGLV